ncbi:YCF1-Vacuolar `full-size` ABC transporter responsible for vacuolar sequestration of glutathione-S-conjugates [Fusarium mangiferae]|uniref:YCF1-Vacuolar `full-size` ABC transporter responsible for vacuolar sequestration of glutathione-S-conjugates n=1 Tax=Fusarium mangiferae TaxID=192010 RepID=A0A1L7UHR2_FUSMA|nr:YCF1-Vacuolar `full-size` ABC transporter responsible for vacuolar sequestration of glutathione-S-conjugates [Fusarium mangiferae]CVL07585.1 YCF1-Vacuolar `full-size` ABC transporter responsible for vacuolar sequestration of glutathione-S-conjugates [Fusarium mangiferae]
MERHCMRFTRSLELVRGGHCTPYQVPDGAGKHPLTHTPFLPSITLSWLDPLLKRATRFELSTEHLWPIDEKLGEPYALTEADASLQRWRFLLPKGLPRIMLLECTGPLVRSGLLEMVAIVTVSLQPFLLGALLEQRRYTSVIALFITGMVGGAARAHARYQLRMAGMGLRAALTALICDRNLEISSAASVTNAPDPVILMEVDLPQVFALVEAFHTTYLAPLQCIIGFIALAYILTWQSMLAGLGLVAIGVPLFMLLMSLISQRLSSVMEAKDARVSTVNEMLAQVRQIKLQGWQSFFNARIDAIRAYELMEVGRVALLNGALVALSTIIPTGLVAVTLVTYNAMGGQLTSQVMFPALAFFFNINSGLQATSQLAMIYQAGVISLERIKDHLMPLDEPMPRKHLDALSVGPSVIVEEGTISTWQSGNGHRLLLRDINFEAVQKGLTVISGPLGSGKSTFLRSLIGDVRQLDSNIKISGTIAYCPQVPVLIHGTVRDNILFGLPYDPSFYQRVIDATALSIDLPRLAHGDQTRLDGTGAALSGGQKSRVALARAVYSRRDIVILDNPLAALDTKVRAEVIDQVLGHKGILQDQIRIVTSSCQPLIEAADRVYTISDLRLLQGAEFIEDPSITSSAAEDLSRTEELLIRDESLVVPPTSQVGCGTFDAKSIATVHVTDATEEAPLLGRHPTEVLASGQPNVEGVPLRVYISYLGMANRGGWYVVIVLAIMAKLADVVALFVLRLATEGAEGFHFLGAFTALSSVGSILSFVFVMTAYFLCLIPASRRLHDRLTKAVLESQFRFFDDNSPGQILSRFTNDINKVDSQLNAGLIRFVIAVVMALAPIAVIIATVPLSIVYLIPLGFLYKYVQAFYLGANRQLRRLENVSRETIISITEEMATGASVIRCFNQEQLFKQRARDAIDGHIITSGPFQALKIWLDLRLQLLASLVTLLSATLILSLNIPSGTLGLVMNFVLQITNLFNSLVEVRAGLEADITSYESIQMYKENHSEEDVGVSLDPPLNWPSEGSVVFDSYTASYRPEGKPCLRSLSLSISGGDHVAVVGRTGAGKSSIVLALLRAIEKDCMYGKICIDGLNISSLSPGAIRRRIALVPQEPVVISGTLRENLDPLGDIEESDLRRALASCQVIEILGILQDEDPLEHRISRSNLSAGQTQVLALARAVAAKCKIIILDEATAALDAKVATAVRKVLKSKFRDCTMIAITHDMDSAKAYDQVLVIDHGRVAEYDTPQALIQNGRLSFLS